MPPRKNTLPNIKSTPTSPSVGLISTPLHSSPLRLDDMEEEQDTAKSGGLWPFLKRKDHEVARALALDEVVLQSELRRRVAGEASPTSPRQRKAKPPPLPHSHHLRRVFPGRSETLRHSGAPSVADASLQRPPGIPSSPSWVRYALQRFAAKLVALFDMREAARLELPPVSPSKGGGPSERYPELMFARHSATRDPYLHHAISFPQEWDALVTSSVPPEYQADLQAILPLFQFVAFQVAAAEKRYRHLAWENDALRRRLSGREGAMTEEEAAAMVSGATSDPSDAQDDCLDASEHSEEIITNSTLRSAFLHQAQLYRESVATLATSQHEELIASSHDAPNGSDRPELLMAAQLGAIAVGETVLKCGLSNNGTSNPTYLTTGSSSLCDAFHGGRHIPNRHSLPPMLHSAATRFGHALQGQSRMLTPNTSRDTIAQDIVGAVLGYAGVELGFGASGKMTPVQGGGGHHQENWKHMKTPTAAATPAMPEPSPDSDVDEGERILEAESQFETQEVKADSVIPRPPEALSSIPPPPMPTAPTQPLAKKPVVGPLAYMNQLSGVVVPIHGKSPNSVTATATNARPVNSDATPLSHSMPTPIPHPPSTSRLVDHMPAQSLTARLVRGKANAQPVGQPLSALSLSAYARDVEDARRRREEMVALEKRLYSYTSQFPSKASQNVYGGGAGSGVDKDEDREREERERAKIREAIKRHNDERLRKGNCDGAGQDVGSQAGTNASTVRSLGMFPSLVSPRRPPVDPQPVNFSKVVTGDKSELDSYLQYLDKIATSASREVGGEKSQ